MTDNPAPAPKLKITNRTEFTLGWFDILGALALATTPFFFYVIGVFEAGLDHEWDPVGVTLRSAPFLISLFYAIPFALIHIVLGVLRIKKAYKPLASVESQDSNPYASVSLPKPTSGPSPTNVAVFQKVIGGLMVFFGATSIYPVGMQVLSVIGQFSSGDSSSAWMNLGGVITGALFDAAMIYFGIRIFRKS